jgi:hypothetical protein
MSKAVPPDENRYEGTAGDGVWPNKSAVINTIAMAQES